MPRRAANIPANETNAQRFVRLANHRVNTILTGFKGLGGLGGTNYVSTPEQRKKIETVLTDALKSSMASMASGGGPQEFKL